LIDWKERYSKGGVCDFRENYDFYFKWLTNKVASCFIIKNLPETINQTFLKTNLILNGIIGITQFNGTNLYACRGNLGGEPDEYYRPTRFIISNPVLGSKSMQIRDFKGKEQDGVLISNTDIDSLFMEGVFDCGLHTFINQTATLLADNIISINCAQINSRVTAFFTADSEGQAVAGEVILKKMYAGRPYQILRQDMIEKINVNPMSGNGGAITELVELHNYIIAQFLQNIGIKANDIRKKERMIQAEISEQDNLVQLSITEMLASWQKGFDEVNELFGTDIQVELNPILLPEVLNGLPTENDADYTESNIENDAPIESEDVKEKRTISETTEIQADASLEDMQEQLDEVIDVLTEGGDSIDEDTEDSQSP
jgi:hypothetical protein